MEGLFVSFAGNTKVGHTDVAQSQGVRIGIQTPSCGSWVQASREGALGPACRELNPSPAC